MQASHSLAIGRIPQSFELREKSTAQKIDHSETGVFGMKTSKTIQWLVTLLLALTFWAFSATVQAQARTGKRIALVIGNDAYQHVNKLQKAGNDATAMARELRAAGFEVQLHRDLNYQRMVKAVEILAGSITGGDQVVVFFAGHGVQIRSGSYLLPIDIDAGSESEVEKFAYNLGDLTDKLSEAKASFTLVMVDACRDNPLKSKGRSVGGARGLSAIEPPKGQMVVYSASKGQQALDRLSDRDTNPNGVFTREFIAKMRKPGVRIEDLVREVQDSVEALARTVSHDQRPAIYNEARGNFYFFGPTTVQVAPQGSSPVQARTAEQIEDAYWDGIKDSSDKAAFDDYLKDYPSGRYALLAKRHLQKLKDEARGQAAASPAKATGTSAFKDCPACPELVVIPAGSFTMGSSAAEQAHANAAGIEASFTSQESPQRNVSVRGFAVGRYAVTRAEFAAFVRAKSYQTEAEQRGGCYVFQGGVKRDKAYNWRNAGFDQADDHPVVCVSWNDAHAYTQWLSQTSGKSYRLLSEAEREYAARAGTRTAFWWGDSINANQANYIGTGKSFNGSPLGEWRKTTVPVNSFGANPFGLYNMHGNVWEWVQDVWHDNYKGAPVDGTPWVTGGDSARRVLRGGSWLNDAGSLRAASRISFMSDYSDWGNAGFRIARGL